MPIINVVNMVVDFFFERETDEKAYSGFIAAALMALGACAAVEPVPSKAEAKEIQMSDAIDVLEGDKRETAVSETIGSVETSESALSQELQDITDRSSIDIKDSLFQIIEDRIGSFEDMKIVFSYLDGAQRLETALSDHTLFLDTIRKIPADAQDSNDQTSTGYQEWIVFYSGEEKILTITGQAEALILSCHIDGDYTQKNVNCDVNPGVSVFNVLKDIVNTECRGDQ